MISFTRKATLVGVAAMMMLLAGCTSYTYADAEATPFSVVETREAQMFSGSEFSYIDREGNLKPLSECGNQSFFEQRSCQSESGAVSFAYSVDEDGALYSAKVTVDGETHKMKCNFDTEKFLSTLSICLPVS